MIRQFNKNAPPRIKSTFHFKPEAVLVLVFLSVLSKSDTHCVDKKSG